MNSYLLPLLGRRELEIDNRAVSQSFVGSTILVTGAAGHIGSELCRRIARSAPRLLLMLDIDESRLYELVTEIHESQAKQAFSLTSDECGAAVSEPSFSPIVCDITNRKKLERVFSTYRPALVFHGAAFKHIPLMEKHPDEAIRVNVLGTKVVTELAASSGTERFVFLSSDKAVNPQSIVGATKRLCDMLIMTMGTRMEKAAYLSQRRSSSSHESIHTLFTSVRLANVLGSRGSVVPTLERQIKQGKPVTVTHPDATRYFISLSEALSLVAQAASLTEGGDLFILDMSRRIRILDLATRLITLHGLRPGFDIPIVYTGLRPGDKMDEELIAGHEQLVPTAQRFIFRVRSEQAFGDAALECDTEELISLAQAQRNDEAVRKLWQIVSG